MGLRATSKEKGAIGVPRCSGVISTLRTHPFIGFLIKFSNCENRLRQPCAKVRTQWTLQFQSSTRPLDTWRTESTGTDFPPLG